MDGNIYMQRCFDLARQAGKDVLTNPHVGAVIVYEDRIIGEGYHKKFGGHHAEVEAIRSVNDADKSLLSESTLYVSLEPCNHQGKTPPCTQAILNNKIKQVVVSALDSNPQMSGNSVTLLRNAGVMVRTGVLRIKGQALIRSYNVIRSGRPFIILKYAQSRDGYIGQEGKQVWLSNTYSKHLVHKWRSEVDGILIGVNTANTDNPNLTTRLYPGASPIRIILDPHNRLKTNLNILNKEVETLILTKEKLHDDDRFLAIGKDYSIERILECLYEKQIFRILIEGGSYTLSKWIDKGMWDEARVITAAAELKAGIKAPMLKGSQINVLNLDEDYVQIIQNDSTC